MIILWCICLLIELTLLLRPETLIHCRYNDTNLRGHVEIELCKFTNYYFLSRHYLINLCGTQGGMEAGRGREGGTGGGEGGTEGGREGEG